MHVYLERYGMYTCPRLKTGYTVVVVLESFQKQKSSHSDCSVKVLWLSIQFYLNMS